MKNLFVSFVVCVFCFYNSVFASKIEWKKILRDKFTIYYVQTNSTSAIKLEFFLENGITTVEKYFNIPFAKKFEVYLFPSRMEIDKQWGKDWDMPGFKSECWMVASGVAHRLDVLSFDRWKTEACEHNADNEDHLQKIITHELVHVFHGQNNPIQVFTGMDDIGWFVEGVAVLVSGQLDSVKIKDLKEAKSEKKLPVQLEKAWSGKYRYAVAGSIVSYIVKKHGDQTIYKLLSFTKEKEILDFLNITEIDLLGSWKNTL